MQTKLNVVNARNHKVLVTLGSRQATRRFITRCFNHYLENGGKGKRAKRLAQVPSKYREAFVVQPATKGKTTKSH